MLLRGIPRYFFQGQLFVWETTRSLQWRVPPQISRATLTVAQASFGEHAFMVKEESARAEVGVTAIRFSLRVRPHARLTVEGRSGVLNEDSVKHSCHHEAI